MRRFIRYSILLYDVAIPMTPAFLLLSEHLALPKEATYTWVIPRLAPFSVNHTIMDLLNNPESVWKIGFLAIIAICVYLTTYRTSLVGIVNRISTRGRRDSTARTPPRSFSPEKKNASSTKSPASYNDALPPHRRESLLELQGHCFKWSEVSEAEMQQKTLPMTADYKKSPGNLYTPTGFTIDEVKTLGDFPDYATLSGVPLPKPYRDFDIAKALPRPYRPFRWAYHQTMCMLPLPCNGSIPLD